jgi:predicted DCC family thiol-disulfide oxidoreductase YuxK
LNSNHRPSKVIYDGDCPICQSLKDYSETRVQPETINFVPFQSKDLLNVATNLTQLETSQSLYFITETGQQFRGARAVFEVMSHMPGFWGAAGKILRVPPFYWIAEPFYRLFARHRHGFGVGVGTKDE